MAAYCIVDVEVHTPEVYETYRRHTLATVERYGGRFLVRGGAVTPVEGGWTPSRIVVLEFPTMADLERWYRSPEYQAILPGRHDGAHSRMVFVEGVASAP